MREKIAISLQRVACFCFEHLGWSLATIVAELLAIAAYIELRSMVLPLVIGGIWLAALVLKLTGLFSNIDWQGYADDMSDMYWDPANYWFSGNVWYSGDYDDNNDDGNPPSDYDDFTQDPPD